MKRLSAIGRFLKYIPGLKGIGATLDSTKTEDVAEIECVLSHVTPDELKTSEVPDFKRRSEIADKYGLPQEIVEEAFLHFREMNRIVKSMNKQTSTEKPHNLDPKETFEPELELSDHDNPTSDDEQT